MTITVYIQRSAKCYVKVTLICRKYWINLSERYLMKALFNEVTRKIAQVRGNLISKNDKYKFERSILLSRLNDHVIRLKTLTITQIS